MTKDELDRIVARRLDSISYTLTTKNAGYGFGGDVLHNFKTAARIRGTTMENALCGMLLKHLASVLDLVDGRLPATQANVDEKIGDTVNYMVLLEAVFAEKRDGGG
jgi:hypothetical protein